MNIFEKIERSKKAILSVKGFKPETAVIAGSGLSGISKRFTVIKKIKYSNIPFFLQTTVSGHSGEVLLCRNKKNDILLFSGRFHFYEGHTPQNIIYPVRVMKEAGIKNLIITAAAGGINTKYKAGDIVLIKDHINFTGNNPLIGIDYDKFGKRFPDMGEVYDPGLRKIVKKIALKRKIKIQEGVYFAVSGPSYETPAEVKAFRKLGGDAAGMSVVYEAIAAAQSGIKALGLAYVSNMAAGISKRKLDHGEVLDTGKLVNEKMSALIKEITESIK